MTTYPFPLTAAQRNIQLARLITIDDDATIVVNGKALVFGFFDVRGKHTRLCAMLSEDGCWIEFFGSPTGSHRISAQADITSAERVMAHWSGYVTNSMLAADRETDRMMGAVVS